LRYDLELKIRPIIVQLFNTITAFCGNLRLIAVLATPAAGPHDISTRIIEDHTKDFRQTLTDLYVVSEKMLRLLTASLNKLQRNRKICSRLK
jgi:hypothetical protein